MKILYLAQPEEIDNFVNDLQLSKDHQFVRCVDDDSIYTSFVEYINQYDWVIWNPANAGLLEKEHSGFNSTARFSQDKNMSIAEQMECNNKCSIEIAKDGTTNLYCALHSNNSCGKHVKIVEENGQDYIFEYYAPLKKQ